jgi:hypothetical protein
LDSLCTYNRASELTDFLDISRRLSAAWSREELGVWLILAVTKCDLYWDRLSEAHRSYMPTTHHSEKFAASVRDLVNSVGTDRMNLAILPVSSVSASYRFNDITVSHQFDPMRRKALLSRLQTTIGDFSRD